MVYNNKAELCTWL